MAVVFCNIACNVAPSSATNTESAYPAASARCKGECGTAELPTGDNVLSVYVDPGPNGIGYVNGLFSDVTICIPGSSECQTITRVLVDTGSVGLRILDSVLDLNLPFLTDSNGAPIAECIPFAGGVAWGAVRTADLSIANGRAFAIPIQVIGVTAFEVPNACAGNTMTDASHLGANGILGVGLFPEDCGAPCSDVPSSIGNPGMYYACPSSSRLCRVAGIPLSAQVRHPVASLTSDNNGVMIQLPVIPDGGSPSVRGVLVLGVATRENNALDGATVLTTDLSGSIQAQFPIGRATYPAFLDTGSNAVYFLNQVLAGMPTCNGYYSPFYCPDTLKSISAVLLGANGKLLDMTFNVGNAADMLDHDANFAFSNLAGPMPGSPNDSALPGFVLGLPFHFGRRVFIGVEGRTSSAGTGPFVAL